MDLLRNFESLIEMATSMVKLCVLVIALYLEAPTVSGVIPLKIWPTTEISACPNQTWIPPGKLISNQLTMAIEYSTKYVEDTILIIERDISIIRPNKFSLKSACFNNITYVWESETGQFVEVSIPEQNNEGNFILIYMDDELNYGVLYQCRSPNPNIAIFKRPTYEQDVKALAMKLMQKYGSDLPNFETSLTSYPEAFEVRRLAKKCNVTLDQKQEQDFHGLFVSVFILFLIGLVLLCSEVL